jgi:hypothetical protein
MEKEIPRDRNGTPLPCGTYVRIYSNHEGDFFRKTGVILPRSAKVVFPGTEKSLLESLEGREIRVLVDNRNLEVI